MDPIDPDKFWKRLNLIAKRKGEFGFSTLTEEEMKSAIAEALEPKKPTPRHRSRPLPKEG